jgi:hypothetical protein
VCLKTAIPVFPVLANPVSVSVLASKPVFGIGIGIGIGVNTGIPAGIGLKN